MEQSALNKYRLFIIYSILIFSCNDISSDSDAIKYESFTSCGETKPDSYIFCSTVPIEINYTYRIGIWRFISSTGYIAAEGEYNVRFNTVRDIGGCPYCYKSTTINLEKWKFWNENGELIEPSKKLINIIQTDKMSSRNPFEGN